MQEMLTLTTRMNALARITLGNVNIAATTALQVGAMHLFSSSNLFFAKPKIKLPPMPQAIDAVGREIALRRGANILMPILTPTKYREHYTLYEGEPGMRPACLAWPLVVSAVVDKSTGAARRASCLHGHLPLLF